MPKYYTDIRSDVDKKEEKGRKMFMHYAVKGGKINLNTIQFTDNDEIGPNVDVFFNMNSGSECCAELKNRIDWSLEALLNYDKKKEMDAINKRWEPFIGQIFEKTKYDEMCRLRAENPNLRCFLICFYKEGVAIVFDIFNIEKERGPFRWKERWLPKNNTDKTEKVLKPCVGLPYYYGAKYYY